MSDMTGCRINRFCYIFCWPVNLVQVNTFTLCIICLIYIYIIYNVCMYMQNNHLWKHVFKKELIAE